MLNALGLGFLIQAKDESHEVFHKVGHNLHHLKDAGEGAHKSVFGALKMSGVAVAGIGAAIGVAGVAGAFEFAEHAERFSSAIRRAGVAAHATGEQLEQFEHFAKADALDSLKGSAIETAEMLEQLTKEGYSLEEAAQALHPSLDLVRIAMGALSPQSAAGLVNDTLGQFGMNASDAGELVDKLAFSMKTFGFRAEELQGVMSGLSSGAKLVGASLDDTLIGVGIIKQVFPSATKAASAMNVAMQQLASKHTQKELAGIGLAVKDNHGKMKPLLQIMTDLSARTAKMTSAQLANKLATIGSARAAGGLSVIIDALRKGVKDENGHLLTGAAALGFYRKQLQESQGSAKRMADMLGDDLGGALKALKGGLSNAGVAFGALFEGGFKNAIQTMNLFVRALTQLFTQGGFSGDVKEALDKRLGIKDFAIKIFLWVERIKNFFSNLGTTFMTAFEPFRPVLDNLISSFGMLAESLGLSGGSADDNASKWESFGEAGARVGEILANLAGAVIPVVTGVVLALFSAVEIAKQAWEEHGATIMNIVGIISGAVRVVGGLLSGNWKMAWDGFIDVVAGAAKAVIGILMGVLNSVAKVIDGIGGVFGQKWDHSGMIKDLEKEWKGNVSFGANEIKGFVQGEPTPAKAAIEGQAKAHAAAMPGDAGGEQHIHTHTTLKIDGEALAEAHSSAKRSRAARGFRDVSSHEGGF